MVDKMSVFECSKCGDCCRGMIYLTATADDLLNWKDRPDILKFVKDGNFWVDSLTGKRLESCPWFENNLCKIHEIKPHFCANFPGHELQIKKICGGGI